MLHFPRRTGRAVDVDVDVDVDELMQRGPVTAGKWRMEQQDNDILGFERLDAHRLRDRVSWLSAHQ